MTTAILLILVGALLALAGYGCGYAHGIADLAADLAATLTTQHDDDLDEFVRTARAIRNLPEVRS